MRASFRCLSYAKMEVGFSLIHDSDLISVLNFFIKFGQEQH